MGQLKNRSHNDYITFVISSKTFETKRTQCANTMTKNSKNPFKILHINDHVLDVMSCGSTRRTLSLGNKATHTHRLFYSSEYQGLMYQL